MSIESLGERAQEIHDSLPATVEEIAGQFEISRSTVRDHLSEIDEKVGTKKVAVEDGDTRYMPVRKDSVNPDDHDQPPSKQSISKKANRHLIKLERRLGKLLDDSQPLPLPETQESGREDVAIHRTDPHIGDVVTNEFGQETFNVEIAVERERAVTEKTIRLVDRQESAGYECGTAHLILGGDIVTGENIYDHQPHNIAATLDEQIDLAVELYLEQIKTLAERFEAVQVVCQLGNHGQIRGSGLSEAANADRVVYMMLERLVGEGGLDNVGFVRNDATNFTNFRMRGHKAHLRHGHNCLQHIGTSSGKNRWRGWKLKNNFDVAYWGHYHSFEMDEVHGVPVIRSGSIKPPDDFEEGLSEHGEPAATVHGVSDERPVTWLFPVDFNN